MSDLTDPLDEALGLYKEIGHELVQVAADLIDPFDAIVAAARRVAEAPEVWWCEEHRLPGAPEPIGESCRMVRKLLVDP